MKKFISMIAIAMVAMLCTTLTSCGDDDDVDNYTLSCVVTQGNLSDAQYILLKAAAEKQVTNFSGMTKEEAVLKFEIIMAAADFASTLKEGKAEGATGVSLTYYLKNSKGEVIAQKTFSTDD